MELPKEFISYTRELFGEERWQRYVAAFDEEAPVSIRLNPFKKADADLPIEAPVPWCRNAYYLKERPVFTADPLIHAGAYYVQEAGSMFLDEVLRQHLSDDVAMALDMCAAPGGKSTLLRAVLPETAMLMSNEPDRRRANILMENMQKQGHPNVMVTNNYPRDYKKARGMFDFILADVPCSGEGMFRKDADTIGEWSQQKVMECADLQRSIIEDIWPCLKAGGILVYSTCTFNTHEDEENVRWIAEELGAEILPVVTRDEWNISGSLLKGWTEPVYRFIPGTTRGEGLFMAVLRKKGDGEACAGGKHGKGKWWEALRILSDGNPQPTQKGKSIIPAHAEALLVTLDNGKYPSVELSREEALAYLKHEALVLPDDTPRGFVLMRYKGLPLGFVKNIGTRANNLYPKEWIIRNSSIS